MIYLLQNRQSGMKKIFILLITLFSLSVGVYAQKGKQAIGFGLGYGTEIESLGLGIKYQYNITNPIRIDSKHTAISIYS